MFFFFFISGPVSFGERFWSDFGSDFGRFGEARTPIRMVNTDTKRMSAFFGPSRKKRPKIAKTRPTKRQKSIKKHKRTSRHFVAFCGRDFFTFLTKNGPQRGGGELQKTQKNAKNRLREISWFRPALRERSWRDLGVLWDGFWVIVWWFWVILGINFNDFFVLPRLPLFSMMETVRLSDNSPVTVVSDNHKQFLSFWLV